MRVALVILHAQASRGGAERYTLDLVAALRSRGHDVTLLAVTGDVPFVRLASGGLTRTGRYRAFCRSLRAHLATTRYDVVHAMLPVPPGLCDIYHPHAGVAATSNWGLSWWLNPRRRLFARTERRLLTGPRPPVTLTLSQYVEDDLRRHYPSLAADRVVRLFNAVDLHRFTPDGPAADRRELGVGGGDVLALFVGNDWNRKGLARAIRAVAAADDPRLKLAVAGRGDVRAYQKLGGPVAFLGPRRDLPALYRGADFLLLPTAHDPCSLVVLEALASGLPVVSTTANGATEIMRDGEHGFVVDANDAGALRVAVTEMLDDTRRARMRDACLALRPSLSWERHVGQLLAIYGRAGRA